MRADRSVLMMFFCVLAACGGGEKAPADTGVSKAPPGAASPGSPSAGTGAPQAITGKTWDVKMLGDAGGYRFDPASLTIKRGDGVRWTVVSGVPHNVSFWPDSIPSGAESVLRANMTQTTAPLIGPLLMNLSQTYTISFAGAPAGTYPYYCTPHLPLGMKGKIVIQ
jgi:plastocyanin